MRGQILHGGDDFLLFLAEAQHHTGFGGNVGMRFLGAIQEFERALVEGALSDLAVEAGNGFGVVVENVWLDGEDEVEGVPIAAKIRDQNFHLAAGDASANFYYGAGEDVCAAIGLIIAIDAGDHGVTQSHAGRGFGYAGRFVFVGRANGLARRDSAESAGASADVSQDHEGGRAMFPAFAHVGAASGFTDGMEIEGAHDALEVVIFFAAKEFNAKPVRARVGIRQRDG